MIALTSKTVLRKMNFFKLENILRKLKVRTLQKRLGVILGLNNVLEKRK